MSGRDTNVTADIANVTVHALPLGSFERAWLGCCLGFGFVAGAGLAFWIGSALNRAVLWCFS